jgi:hypothetical protein
MMVFMLGFQSLSAMSADYGAAMEMPANRCRCWFELYTKTGMGDGQQATNLVTVSILSKSLGITMLLFQMLMLKN